MTLLRRYRKARGMTQDQLAKRLGVSPSCVSFWESGRWQPHAQLYPKLAKLLEIDPLELTKVIDPSAAQATGQTPAHSAA